MGDGIKHTPGEWLLHLFYSVQCTTVHALHIELSPVFGLGFFVIIVFVLVICLLWEKAFEYSFYLYFYFNEIAMHAYAALCITMFEMFNTS